ncbi:MAG: DNA polymerase subunit beta, partial [Boseongicola sp. SB0667_bin_21]|nr:DNA polymerase subunit beta [Boseongicola sp. SB0667_bin_21]
MREAAARSAAARRIIARLSSHARRHGGRFLVFGSAARGDMRHDSDIDILVDFPPEMELDAVIFAEEACSA